LKFRFGDRVVHHGESRLSDPEVGIISPFEKREVLYALIAILFADMWNPEFGKTRVRRNFEMELTRQQSIRLETAKARWRPAEDGSVGQLRVAETCANQLE
jgi:hypothetical protein